MTEEKYEAVSVTAPVNRIIPFSSVDGPGNRTVIFLQGCNLNCKYCHNPETINECTHCLKCLSVCKNQALQEKEGKLIFNITNCIECDECIKVCPYGASPRIRNLTPKEVMSEVIRNIPFIRGITVSGGECTKHPDFITQLFRMAKKEGLSCLLDSNGNFNFEAHQELLEVTDGVMLDVKAYDRIEHEALTGSSNELILKNLNYLNNQHKLLEIRTVVINELMNPEETITNVAQMLTHQSNIELITYKLIRYRPLGVRKEYANHPIPTENYMDELKELALRHGIKKVIIT